MTEAPYQQVPGQLELPLTFEEPLIHTITYFEEVTIIEKKVAKLTVPASYKPLIDQIKANPPQYQRTLKSLVTNTSIYDDVEVDPISSSVVEEVENHSDFRIR